MEEIKWVFQFPRYSELCSEKIYRLIKDQEGIAKYLPNYPEGHIPDKIFLFNVNYIKSSCYLFRNQVVNTLNPNVINELTDGANKLRDVQQEKKDEIEVCQEFLGFFTAPRGIGGNSKAIHALKSSRKERKRKYKERKKFELTKTL